MNNLDVEWSIVELIPVSAAVLPDAERQVREHSFRLYRNAWGEEEDQSLETMFFDDVSMQDIAKALGRTPNAVATRIYDKGWRRNSKVPWNDQEDKTLKARYGNEPTSDIAQELGRSVASVYARAKLLSISTPAALPWSFWEDEQVRFGFQQGTPISVLSSMLGRSTGAIWTRAGRVLNVKHKHAINNWTPEEDELLIALVGAEVPEKQIVKAFAAKDFKRTLAAIAGRKNALGLHLPRNMPWTQEENDILVDGYEKGEALKDIAKKIGRPVGGLSWRANQLGIRHPKPDGFRSAPVWSDEEENTLKQLYGSMPVRAIADLLGRTRSGVYSCAFRLGLDAKHFKNYSTEDLATIEQIDRQGGPAAVRAYAVKQGWNGDVACKKAKQIRDRQGRKAIRLKKLTNQ